MRLILREIKKIIKKLFFQKRLLKKENKQLLYQLNYLKKHISPKDIKPATGFIRDYQMKEIAFMQEINSILNKQNIFPILGGGGVLGLIRHNGFVPWDDDLDFDVLREDFDKIIEYAKKNWVWIEINKQGTLLAKSYDDAIKQNPGKIIAILSPYCLHVYRGTCLKDSVNVEFFILDYIKDSVNEKQIVDYKEKIISYIKKANGNVSKILSFYKQELPNSTVFTQEKTDRLYYGLGNNGLTEYKFHGFLEYSDIFPIQDAVFEGAKVKIPNKPINYLCSLYGNWEKLPSDIGISHKFEYINDYCREYNLEEVNYIEEEIQIK